MSGCVPCMKANENIFSLIDYANSLDIKNPKLASKIDQIVLGMVKESQPWFKQDPEKIPGVFGPSNPYSGKPPSGVAGSYDPLTPLEQLKFFNPLEGAKALSADILGEVSGVPSSLALYYQVFEQAVNKKDIKTIANLYKGALEKPKMFNLKRLDALMQPLAGVIDPLTNKSILSDVKKEIISLRSIKSYEPRLIKLIETMLKDNPSKIAKLKRSIRGQTFEDGINILLSDKNFKRFTYADLADEAVKLSQPPKIGSKAVGAIEQITDWIATNLSKTLSKTTKISVDTLKQYTKYILSTALTYVDMATTLNALIQSIRSGQSITVIGCRVLSLILNAGQAVLQTPLFIASSGGSAITWSLILAVIDFAMDIICNFIPGYQTSNFDPNETKKLENSITQSQLSPNDLNVANQLVNIKNKKMINDQFKGMVANNKIENPNEVGAYLRKQLLTKPIAQPGQPVAQPGQPAVA